MNPKLKFRNGRTKAQFRDDVHVEKIVLVATGGWWVKENLDRLSFIFKEFAAVANISFGGAILRPHAQFMMKDGQLTVDGQDVIRKIRLAAHELIEKGVMKEATLEYISKPLISREEYFNRYKQK